MRRALLIGMDCIGIVGVSAIVYAAWLAYQPLGFALGGAAAVAVAVIAPGHVD